MNQNKIYAIDEDLIGRTVAIFSALADPTRFKMLSALSNREHRVSELAEVANVSPSAASHQLRLLKDRGLVGVRREGQSKRYFLADEHVSSLINQGLAHASHTSIRGEISRSSKDGRSE